MSVESSCHSCCSAPVCHSLATDACTNHWPGTHSPPSACVVRPVGGDSGTGAPSQVGRSCCCACVCVRQTSAGRGWCLTHRPGGMPLPAAHKHAQPSTQMTSIADNGEKWEVSSENVSICHCADDCVVCGWLLIVHALPCVCGPQTHIHGGGGKALPSLSPSLSEDTPSSLGINNEGSPLPHTPNLQPNRYQS